MAKIDVSKIDGYKDMTPEQKLAALEAYEVSDPDYSGYVPKNTFDSKASEAAELARKLKAKQTAEEQAEAERAAKEAEREARIAELEKAAALSEYKARYSALGYDEKLAAETAEAFASGNMDAVFAAQQKHLDAVKKAERAAVLAGAGTPPPAGTSGLIDFGKQIEAANAAGDYSLMAALMRQQQEATQK